jgi:hypothetical protein
MVCFTLLVELLLLLLFVLFPHHSRCVFSSLLNYFHVLAEYQMINTHKLIFCDDAILEKVLVESFAESGGAVVMRSLILLASNDAWTPNSF